ncbi:hypothetical protein CMI37_23480 [Candidatus Pacearchaeota archaeon]|nr:hypothetical protein [Candidatus Pacearchaeota archaeon]
MAKDKTADRIKILFEGSNSWTRQQWEYMNQKGCDFANDNQLTEEERLTLEEQGMPTFTINRIIPVVEMLNYYATANDPRWQAVATEGSDVDVAAVFSDVADYIWNQNDGVSLYANAINDAITKSCGFLVIGVDSNSDHGMGDVIIQQPDPFDVYVDAKSRDLLFSDASFVIIRKILPKRHLINIFPEYKRKIMKANVDNNTDYSYSEKAMGSEQKDFSYKNIGESESWDPAKGENDKLCPLYETYEKIRVPYVNVFYRIPLSVKDLDKVAAAVKIKADEMTKELEVKLVEDITAMEEMVKKGSMMPARLKLESEKAAKTMQQQIESARSEFQSKMVAETSKIENTIVTEQEFKIMEKNKGFIPTLVDAVKFFGSRIKLTCVAGDKTLYEKVLPNNITEYPIIPFHYKWTGTPFPMSAVSPLIGKQRELNKAHQLMVHNASLGSSLRWMHEEGSIDSDYWEKYASSPGALLPIRPGAAPPTPVQPAPLSNAFFGIVNEGKQDMEYLAGIYAAMQGDTGEQHETFRGMLAMDEYGTRRIKQWMKSSIEPALRQMGRVIMQYSQAIYQSHKVFRIVNPNNMDEDKQVELNVPVYNDLGNAIGKFNDYGAAKFDIKVVAGSTLPINRWAYLDELKELLKLGVVDDVAVLAESDVRNKSNIVKRKSMLKQAQQQIEQLDEELKDKDGTIETLERQVVQAGIRDRIMRAQLEVDKKKHEVKGRQEQQVTETKGRQRLLRDKMDLDQKNASNKLNDAVQNVQNKKEKSNG